MKNELFWHVGFVAGAAGAGMWAQMQLADVHTFIRIGLILSAGVGFGWLAESLSRHTN